MQPKKIVNILLQKKPTPSAAVLPTFPELAWKKDNFYHLCSNSFLVFKNSKMASPIFLLSLLLKFSLYETYIKRVVMEFFHSEVIQVEGISRILL